MIWLAAVGAFWLLTCIIFGDIIDHVGTALGIALVVAGALGMVIPVPLALAGGCLAWLGVDRIDTSLRKRATGELPSLQSLVGSSVTVLTPSDAEGKNATALVLYAGTSTELLLSSDDGSALDRGDEAWIVSLNGSRAVVNSIHH